MKEKVFRGVLSLWMAFACAVHATAAEKRPKAKAPAPASNPAAPDALCPANDAFAFPGLRAFIDPQTGQLRQPTPEEAAQLGAAAHAARIRALSELEVVVHPDGMRSVDLKDAFQTDLVARRNPDGSLSIGCVPPGAPSALLPAPRPAAPVLEER